MTTQISETLIINGHILDMNSCPPIPDGHPAIRYLTDEEIQKRPGHHFTESTACWRGYLGTWSIQGDRLYLVKLVGRFHFDGSPPLHAHWVTGTLDVPDGPQISSANIGFPLCERARLLQVENGVIVSQRVIDVLQERARFLQELNTPRTPEEELARELKLWGQSDSEPVNEPAVSEGRVPGCPIEAQSTAISQDMASICNEERAPGGVDSGHGGFGHRFSGQAW